MSVFTVPVDKETHDVDDIEEMLPVYKVVSQRKQTSVEVIDLTEDEFVKEFKIFLNTLPDRRRDIGARICSTKAISKSAKHVLCMPALFLLYVHIHQDTFICELFRMKFKNVMLYGTLTSETLKDDITIYQLDDGTAMVDVYYRKATNGQWLDNLNKLDSCEETLRRKPSLLNEEAIPTSAELRRHLRMLISIAKNQCHKHRVHIMPRTQCFVIGHPFTNIKGKVSVFAHTILSDAEDVTSCELFWKTGLFSMYEPMLENVGDQNNTN